MALSNSQPARRAARLASSLALLILLAPPWARLVRDWLFENAPRAALWFLAALAALLASGLLWLAIRGLRGARWPRWALLGCGLIALALLAAGFATDDPRVGAVERLHLIEYAALSALCFFALGPRIRDWTRIGWALLLSVLVALGDELFQWILPLRTGELRDVLLDAGAAAAGLLAGLALDPLRLQRAGSRSLARLLFALAATALLVAAFIEVAHRGQWVSAPSCGRFRSYFSAAELRARDRALAREPWRATAPPPLVGIEDYAITEAGWHLQHRNLALENQDWAAALGEQRILERYYDSFRRAKGAELEPALRGRGAELGGAPESYVSPVLARRIWAELSGWQLWGAAALVGLSLAGGAAGVRARPDRSGT